MAIKVLDRSTINKIAAGEVIERPASVLKELLENSADSGATRIEIDFEAGGKTEIKVLDNGAGIDPKELLLALEPHATSKISSIEDLYALKTFGFRGEALASIAAVSELTISSSCRSGSDEAAVGATVSCLGGILGEVAPAPALGGTKVTVKNLFYNVPARLKFLKSDGGETAAVKKVIRAFALGHPEISLVTRQQGKVLFHFEKEKFQKRAGRVLEVAQENILHVQAEEGPMKLEMAAALPSESLATQAGLWIFVQGRPVVDRTIQQAIFEGYRNLLMQHQFPQVVLALWVNPAEVDVNVHPTKAQVKFKDNGPVFRFVSRSLKDALEKHFGQTIMTREPTPNLAEATGPDSPTPWLLNEVTTQYNQKSFYGGNSLPEQQTFGTGSFSAPTPTSTPTLPPTPGTMLLETELNVESGVWSSLHLIGQAANTYIVCQSPRALVLIDQHAAHERVLFEKIKKETQESRVEVQKSLFEELIELDRESIETLTDPRHQNLFQDLGFELLDRGPTTLSVTTRPAFLLDVGLKPLFERVAEQLNESGSSRAMDDLMTDIWATMSCHGAIRAGKTLSHGEMKALLRQMDEFAFSSFCPHGRPVSVQWTLRDLEKLFKRIV